MIRCDLPATWLLALGLAFCFQPSWGQDPVPTSPPSEARATGDDQTAASQNVKLPGLVVDLQKRCVDITGTICLDKGMLELIACTRDSKEHESIVAIQAKPMHIHMGLLLLGVKPGHPAMRRPINEQKTQWVDIPPKGDPVDVFLVFKDEAGGMKAHPISDFVARIEDHPDEIHAEGDEANNAFPKTFLFAGSHVREDGEGSREYLSDLSGNVISISTFGDEVLCLPGMYGHVNASLTWQVDATKLPKVGAKVILRVCAHVPAAPTPDHAEPPGSDRTSGTAQQ